MTARTGVWLRFALGTAFALGLLVTLSPARPASRLSAVLQPVVGLAAGGLLYLILVRSLPRRPTPGPSASAAVGKCVLFGVAALNEEIVWRRVLLGELLFGGVVAALAASTLAFAVSHRARPALHLGTGAAFGAVYLTTGALVATVTAHWAYNVLVGAHVGGRRSSSGRVS